ncbi:MAG: acetolactate synthase large subunit [Candidatus Rokuibacteriota bacterium]|nr:MAG: acetolactate synthase large subunit [Candidatus Rokubacteria bacterium]
MKASDLIVQCLEHEEVRYVFGLPGEEILDILDSLLDSRITFVPTRHEQGAAFMADAYGRLTGRPGVCLSTLGPGATNLATGVADANLDRAPLVAITGQAGPDRIHKESHQRVDIVEHLRPLTKWNTRAETAAVIPEVIRKAFKLAESEKPGACHVEVPEDVAREATDGAPLSTERARRPSPDRQALETAARLIEAASFPLIFAGNGVIRGRASAELRAFARTHGIPVAHTFMAKGSMPYDDDLCLLSVGLQARDYISCGFDKADLIIAVGYDPVEYAPKFWNPDRKKPIVHIDFTPAEVDSFYQPAVEVVADVREAIELLGGLVKGQKDPTPYLTLRRFILAELAEGAADDTFPLKPQRILRDLRAQMGREDILISDVGTHKLWIARTFPAYEPNTVLISNGYAAMGFALPAAIAAKLVHPERKVVAVSGDGGFLMNCQELETAHRLGLAVVNVIFRDGGYNLIQWKQQTHLGREAGVRFGNPDFVALAAAFGAKGYRVDSARALAPILAEALAQPGPSIVDVPVDYENAKLTAGLGQLICPI